MTRLLCCRAWPEFSRVNQKWESVVESLFDILSDKEIIYSKVNRGEWLLVEDAIFNQVPERHLKDLLENVLIGANVPVVSVPSHVMDAIRSFTDAKNITVSVTRKELKKSAACYKNLKRQEKLWFLQFWLQDNQYEDLCDLELLPLSNGIFTTFSALARRNLHQLPKAFSRSSTWPRAPLLGSKVGFGHPSKVELCSHTRSVKAQGGTASFCW